MLSFHFDLYINLGMLTLKIYQTMLHFKIVQHKESTMQQHYRG